MNNPDLYTDLMHKIQKFKEYSGEMPRTMHITEKAWKSLKRDNNITEHIYYGGDEEAYFMSIKIFFDPAQKESIIFDKDFINEGI